MSISIPFLVSFHPKIRLYKYWGAVFGAIGISMIPFIIWDIGFTENGFWGFNSAYLLGIYWGGLPIEEWLFFVTIPYACTFTHIAITRLSPTLKLSTHGVHRVSITLLIVFGVLILLNWDKWYTLIDTTLCFVILGIAYLTNPAILRRFYFTFLFMLIPFFIVNGVLTGTGIEEEIVWYNDLENLGIRMGTIPVEDLIYAFSLILLNLLFIDSFTKENLISQPQRVE